MRRLLACDTTGFSRWCFNFNLRVGCLLADTTGFSRW
jgi:hypothetical protein